ncbi:MAG: type II toxin-antitoxin system VapC family toxin [Endozoicomonas sp. (ex Botrylloides leachii)]|nr:type II toxin-antitoxin system VapC family toxin [Endozoicomonas sp. (ex Botrylloides leachii)]
MILLDTNVISETMKQAPDPAVIAWLNEQISETLYLSSVTLAELLFGIRALPDGRRRQQLNQSMNRYAALFKVRILDFDIAAAQQYADLAVLARKKGRGFPVPDGYIAAIASAHGFRVASRDVAPFEAANINVINPWEWRN